MPGLRHLEPKTVGMTGLAVVLGLAVLSMAEVAVDRFREVMDRNVRVFLAVGERVASLVDVGVAGQALFRRDGLEAVRWHIVQSCLCLADVGMATSAA